MVIRSSIPSNNSWTIVLLLLISSFISACGQDKESEAKQEGTAPMSMALPVSVIEVQPTSCADQRGSGCPNRRRQRRSKYARGLAASCSSACMKKGRR